MLGMDGTSGIDENRHHRRRATAARADASRAEQLPSRQLPGAVAEWLRSGLQSRVHRFDSGRRLSVRAVDAPARRWVGGDQRSARRIHHANPRYAARTAPMRMALTTAPEVRLHPEPPCCDLHDLSPVARLRT